jgi:hypothetical protein
MDHAKPIHFALNIITGAHRRAIVSALCFPRARQINAAHATWTSNSDEVTCPSCLDILRARS